MLEPATLLSSVLALVIGKRPLRTGSWFYLGGLGVTLLVGVLAAFVVGNAAASHTSEPKTWVAIVTTAAGALVLVYAVVLFLRPQDNDQMARLSERIDKVASAPAPAIIAAGAALANPGVFMLLAAKSISQLKWGLTGSAAPAPRRPRQASTRPPACGRTATVRAGTRRRRACRACPEDSGGTPHTPRLRVGHAPRPAVWLRAAPGRVRPACA